MQSSSAERKKRDARSGSPSSPAPLKRLQSWKIPAGIAMIFVAALVIVRYSQRADQPGTTSENTQALSRETEVLEKALAENPKDDQALLRLANLYYDARQFARAIMMYDRYLEIHPSNPDARVDLGISYFEMGLVDSSNREEYYTTAKNEMEKALTYNPRHQLACYNLGMVSLHAGDMQEANTWFSKCAAIDSTTEVGKRARQLVHQHSFNNPS